MKKLIFLLPLFLFAYKVEIVKWSKYYAFFNFLKKEHLPRSIYYNLDKKTQKKLTRLSQNEKIFILTNNNQFKQALIPLDSKTQLQIIKKDNKYTTKIVPIIYDTFKRKVTFTINHYLSYDLYKATGSTLLTRKLISIFEDKINFRAIPPNTRVSIIYEDKIRFGKIYDTQILFASISNRYYTYNAFLNPYDNRYYDENGKSLRGMFLKAPLRYKRISSRFGMRLHPILHRWQMHDGVDYVNKIGTPIHSVADGKIIYKGWIRGYGKAIEIKHKDGYVTLYAHLHGFKKGLYVGKWVKQGQIIGYLGNTGLSTGPHLHFGVMRYGKWINPFKIKNRARITLYGKKRKKFLAYIQTFANQNNIALK